MNGEMENKNTNSDNRKIAILLGMIGVFLLVIIVLLFILVLKKDDVKDELLISDGSVGSESASDTGSNNEVSEGNTNSQESNGSSSVSNGNGNGNGTGNNTGNNGNASSSNSYSEDDVVSYFSGLEKEVRSGKWDNVKDKAKEYFVTTVDFIFYDKEVKGYHFKELTDIAKLKVISSALKIDSKIEEKIPGYKQTISSNGKMVYSDVKERLVTSYLDISTLICESNQAGCDTAKSIFSEIKSGCKIGWDFIKGLISSGAGKLKDWYEIYSGK